MDIWMKREAQRTRNFGKGNELKSLTSEGTSGSIRVLGCNLVRWLFKIVDLEVSYRVHISEE